MDPAVTAVVEELDDFFDDVRARLDDERYAAEWKAETKRKARYAAVRWLVEFRGNATLQPHHDDFYEVAEQLAMYLAHGSMPKPEPKTEEPA